MIAAATATAAQFSAAAAIVQLGADVTSTEVHPYSGCMTVKTRGIAIAIIDADGTRSYTHKTLNDLERQS